MGVLTLYANDSAVIDYSAPNTNYYGATETGDYGRPMYFTFAPTAAQIAAIRYHKITAVTFYLYMSYGYNASNSGVTIAIMHEAIDLQKITYNTEPFTYGGYKIWGPSSLEPSGYYNTAVELKASELKNLLTYGAKATTTGKTVQTAKSSHKPYIEITYEDTTVTPELNAKSGVGVLASEIAQTIEWYYYWDSYSAYDLPTITAQQFRWRVKNSSTVHTIDLGANDTSVTIAAGEFPVGENEWAVQVTTSLGVTTLSSWYRFEVKNPIISGMSPGAGAYTPKHAAGVFSWDVQQEALYSPVSVEQKSATLYWRKSGTTTTHSIAVSGSKKSYTMPAETFSDESVDWMVTAITAGDLTATSAWVTVSTTEATPSCKAISPAGIVIDATIANRFSWQHIISTGTPQSKADLQWSADGTTWNTLATVTGENQYYDVPANKFTSGTKYWRVRTYNTDGTASAWSEKAEFIAINAPSAPSIVIQSTGPRPRITWQTTEQEAYQLTLSSGYASGTVYGTEKAWRSPVYLADGSYTVRVRVQNKYGMWSEWSAAALPISHTEGEAITMTATAGNEAALTWQTAGSYDFYLVERDGVAIARTVQKQYIDHTSIGSVTYRVRGCYDESDNYGVSNSDTAEILPETNMICDLETGVWLEMRLSETQLRTNRTSFSAGVSTVHLAGLAYPVEERSEQRDRALSVACAWPHAQRAAALALEALVGRLVCLKDRYGNMAIGSLPSLESNCDEFMRRYSFTISHTNREEAIALDP